MADTPLKKDAAQTLSDIQGLFRQVQDQAASGEVDAGLLDQIGSALQMSVEQVSSPASEPATPQSGQLNSPYPSSEASGGGSSSGSVPSGSAPSQVYKAGEKASTPSAPSSSASLPSASVPHSGAASESATASAPMSKGADDTALPSVPAAAVPPRNNMNFNRAEDEMDRILPDFIGFMQNGMLRKAQEMVGYSQMRFDEYFKAAQHAVLTEAGFMSKNLRKIHNGAPEIYEPQLAKAISASDAPGINLLPLVRLMLPVYAGLVRRTNADTPKMGSDQATWRAQLGFQNVNNSTNFHTAEGAIGDEINETPITFQTPYRDIANNDKVTLKATAAARGYDDPLQISIIRSLTLGLQTQERRLLGDNAALVAPPTTVTGTPGGSGTIGGATDKFAVTALTYHGKLTGSTGVATTGSATGESTATLTGVVNLSAALNVTVTWTPVKGAIAYNVYYLPSGVEANGHIIGTYTTLTTGVLTALPSTGNRHPTTDGTAAALGYEGFIAWCEKSTIYSNAIYGKVANVSLAGAALATNGSGIAAFDTILANLWTTWQISPTAIVCSPQSAAHYTAKIMTLNQPQYRVDVSDKQGQLVGGTYVTTYVNKFAPFGDGNFRAIDIIPSPYMFDGTYLFLCESVPYAMARESRGFARDVLIPWTYFPLAQVAINYPFAVTTSEVLECFHPSVQTAVVGVDVSAS